MLKILETEICQSIYQINVVEPELTNQLKTKTPQLLKTVGQ
jgi:hypothetical protein